ncbi:MAG TPA: hypothetical protein VHM31_02930 [Polyangia bacterium]|nr:hypothetical protein [Polyangia bacterium]
MTSPSDKAISRRGTRGGSFLRALLALAGAATLGGACTHAHLSDNYGQSYAAWFNAQHIRTPTATSEPARRALSSLDSQEAAAISKNYRKTVGGQESGTGQGQMVMIGQGQGGRMEAYTPPPSVPGGQ